MTATSPFVRRPRIPPPAVATGDVAVDAPPLQPEPSGRPVLTRLLPVLLAVLMVPLMAVAYRSGSARPPAYLLFPLLMLVSAVTTAAIGWRNRHGTNIDAEREDYLDYLSRLRESTGETAAAQRLSLTWTHPHPDELWTLAGGPRMWERRPDDADFGWVRAGVGPAPLATRLVPAQRDRAERADPVTDAALRRFLDVHATVADVPIAVPLLAGRAVLVDGDPDRVSGLLAALVCQLAVFHGPDLLLIAAVVSERAGRAWDWLKWLPHHRHPDAVDAAGPARMVYPSLAAAEAALAESSVSAHLLVVADPGVVGGAERISANVTVIQAGEGAGRAPEFGLRLHVCGETLTVREDGAGESRMRADQMDPTAAVVCARRLAGYRLAGPAGRSGRPQWPELIGIGRPAGGAGRFDCDTGWAGVTRRDRLRVPIGTDTSGEPVDLDIKEAAEGGIGPHGLCIGATGSGKSELLRTIALGMITRHSPADLNLVLVDFKGGATFLGLERARHVAAVITNLVDETPLVARMRDALAGEMNRRQELLRTAGNFAHAGEYQDARAAGAPLAPLPALLVIVDEFSELLSQHPDFADMFAAVGRLGRSLGIHLLLASQRLDEGRLRGLESHLSYRICLKTLSAGESRAVIGLPDAHQLPNTPGVGYLGTPAGDLVGFQAAFVSGPCPDPDPARRDSFPPSVHLFTADPVGPVSRGTPAAGAVAGGRTMLQAVLESLPRTGPRAREVWLPPLGDPPALARLLTDHAPGDDLVLPVGIVDRPFEQRRTPLLVDVRAAAGNVAIVGAPQSGKSTALATLVTALADRHDPLRVQVYGLDFGGGALTSLRSLPHMGSVAGRTQRDLVRRTVSWLESIAAQREALFADGGIASMERYRLLRAEQDPVCDGDRFGDVFLVIDGWAELCREFDALEARIVALAGRGLSFGVHVVLTASRWAEIRPALRDQLATRIELRLGDPADSEVDRRQAALVPRDRPGRGLTDGGLHMLIAVPEAAERSSGLLRRRYHHTAAPSVPVLPAVVHRDTLMGPAGVAVLGIDERELAVVTIDFDRQPHLLILGDNGCGKTSTLRTLCRELVGTPRPGQARLTVIDYRRSLLDVVAPDRLDGYAVSRSAVNDLLPPLLERLARRMPGPDVTTRELRDRSWWSGPDLYLLIDDYDLVATAAGNPLTPLLDFLPYAGDIGLHLVIARRSGGAARAVYEPLLAALRDLGCMGLVMSGHPDEGPLIGASRPGPLPPGRGTLVTTGGERLIQVAWSPPP